MAAAAPQEGFYGAAGIAPTTGPVQYVVAGAGVNPVNYATGQVAYTLPANFNHAAQPVATYAAPHYSAPQVVSYAPQHYPVQFQHGTPAAYSYVSPPAAYSAPSAYSYVGPPTAVSYPTTNYVTAPSAGGVVYQAAPAASTMGAQQVSVFDMADRIHDGVGTRDEFQQAVAGSNGAATMPPHFSAQGFAGAPNASGTYQIPSVQGGFHVPSVQSLQGGFQISSLHSVQAGGTITSAGAMGTPYAAPGMQVPVEQPGSFIHLAHMPPKNEANNQQAPSFVATAAQMEAAINHNQASAAASSSRVHPAPRMSDKKGKDDKKKASGKNTASGKTSKKKKTVCLCF